MPGKGGSCHTQFKARAGLTDNTMRLAAGTTGRGCGPEARNRLLTQKPRKRSRFRGWMSRPYRNIRPAEIPSSIQTITVGSGISPDPAFPFLPAERTETVRAAAVGSARGLYHRSGISPCPEGPVLFFTKSISRHWLDVNRNKIIFLSDYSINNHLSDHCSPFNSLWQKTVPDICPMVQ